MTLKAGDTVIIVSSSGCIEKERLVNAQDVLSSWGLEVLMGEHTLDEYGIFAGNDNARLEDVQWAINHPQAKAIIFSRGGYGAARIIDALDFSALERYPKLLVGFSDITVFHSRLSQLEQFGQFGIASLHSAMPQNYPVCSNGNLNDISLLSLYKALFEGRVDFEWNSADSENGTGSFFNTGKVIAQVVGGNLSLLYSLRGTPADIDFKGKILLIEDLNEMDYHIDRMLQNLKQGGCFEQIAGLIVGQFTDIKSGVRKYPLSLAEMIQEYTSTHNIPVAMNAPIGHIPSQQAIFMNKETTFEVLPDGISIIKQSCG
ncbi:MAG: LD-carboxypeptidase [Bacteroidales bacterium]|nr:LD-carboxypeptidase [Bacteroidales bacterium]